MAGGAGGAGSIGRPSTGGAALAEDFAAGASGARSGGGLPGDFTAGRSGPGGVAGLPGDFTAGRSGTRREWPACPAISLRQDPASAA